MASNIAAASQSAVAAIPSVATALPIKNVATGAGVALKAASGALKSAGAAAKSASTSLTEKAANVSALASSSRGRRVLKLAAVGLTASALAAGVLQFRKHYNAARKEKEDAQRGGAQPAPSASPKPVVSSASGSATGPAIAPAPATPAACPVASATAATGDKSVTFEKPQPLTFARPPGNSEPAANSSADKPGRLEDQIGAALNLAFSRLGLNLRATSKAD